MKENRKWMFLSVVIGIFLWLYVVSETNPTQSIILRGYKVNVLNINELSKHNLQIVSTTPDSIDIFANGKRNVISRFARNQYSIQANIKKMIPGEQKVELEYNLPPGVSTDYDKTTHFINVSIEKVVTKEVPVEVQLVGNKKSDFLYEEPIINPEMITIKGISSEVDKIDKLIARVDIDNVENNITRNIEVDYDLKDDYKLNTIKLGQNFVNISMNVLKIKEVPIKINTIGTLASGYVLSDVKQYVDTIKIKGNKDIIDKINEIETKPFDISTLVQPTEKVLNLYFPDGVHPIDETMNSIKVNFDVKSSVISPGQN